VSGEKLYIVKTIIMDMTDSFSIFFIFNTSL